MEGRERRGGGRGEEEDKGEMERRGGGKGDGAEREPLLPLNELKGAGCLLVLIIEVVVSCKDSSKPTDERWL